MSIVQTSMDHHTVPVAPSRTAVPRPLFPTNIGLATFLLRTPSGHCVPFLSSFLILLPLVSSVLPVCGSQ